MSIFVSVCLYWCLCNCVHGNSKTNGSIPLKLEHIVVYENSLYEFNIGHCPIKVKVKDFEIFSIYNIQTIKFYISALTHVRKF